MSQNFQAFLISLLLSITFVLLVGFAAKKWQLDRSIRRKIIHIGTGPIYVLTWLLFDQSAMAEYWAAVVPLLLTVYFVLVGLNIIKDKQTSDSMSRSGIASELLLGPTFYGIMFVLMTILAWKNNYYGIVALMILCAGDGAADLAGSRINSEKLPWSKEKTWIGSLAFIIAGFLLSSLIVLIVNNNSPLAIQYPGIFWKIGLITIVSAFVESLPFKNIDNLTVPVTAYIIGFLLG